jgi:ornithine cyclodeaminase/alanine dehydrogenase-like protein (mu-crystallin family)
VPILAAEHVRPGTFVAAVGADNERKSEIASSLLERARIVTDLSAQCRKIGDLRNAMPNETFVCGELADVVAGRIPRTGPNEIVVFDSTGLALEDLAVCQLLLT